MSGDGNGPVTVGANMYYSSKETSIFSTSNDSFYSALHVKHSVQHEILNVWHDHLRPSY